MAYANHEINALITIDPNKAKDAICAALRDAGMHKGNAADRLGCTHSTLLRWIAKLDLDARIEKMLKQAEKDGSRFNGRTGRPQGATVENGAAPRGSLKAAKEKSAKKTASKRGKAA
jgi:predicted transcriptional regulator